jgi:hypothetical protein
MKTIKNMIVASALMLLTAGAFAQTPQYNREQRMEQAHQRYEAQKMRHMDRHEARVASRQEARAKMAQIHHDRKMGLITRQQAHHMRKEVIQHRRAEHRMHRNYNHN